MRHGSFEDSMCTVKSDENNEIGKEEKDKKKISLIKTRDPKQGIRFIENN